MSPKPPKLRKIYLYAYALAASQIGLAGLTLAAHLDPTIYLVTCGLAATVGFIKRGVLPPGLRVVDGFSEIARQKQLPRG